MCDSKKPPNPQHTPFDPNRSPTGWYIASYLLRFVELEWSDRDDPEARFLAWENTKLVRADSFDEAYEKAVGFAGLETDPYKGGTEGVDVQWVFEGLTELMPIYEELEDGSEIMWSKHSPKKLRHLRKWVRTKEELARSSPSDDEKGK